MTLTLLHPAIVRLIEVTESVHLKRNETIIIPSPMMDVTRLAKLKLVLIEQVEVSLLLTRERLMENVLLLQWLYLQITML